MAGADPRIQIPRSVAHGPRDGRVVRPLSEGERAVRRGGGGRASAAAPRQAVQEGVQPVGVHRRGDRLAAGCGGGPPERPPQTQYGESGPQAAARTRPQRRRGFRGAPSRTARRAARPAGGRCLHDGQHDAFVRRGDAARRTRMPDQHRGARRLAAGAGGEGVIGN